MNFPFVDRVRSDALLEKKKQTRNRPAGRRQKTAKKRKLKYYGWSEKPEIAQRPSYKYQSAAKEETQRLQLNWHMFSNIGTQPRDIQGAGQLHRIAVIILSQSTIGLMRNMYKYPWAKFDEPIKN